MPEALWALFLKEIFFQEYNRKMKPTRMGGVSRGSVTIWTPIPALTEILVGYLHQYSSFRPRGVETLSELRRVEGGVILWVIPTSRDFQEVLLWMQSGSLSRKVQSVLWLLSEEFPSPLDLGANVVAYLGRGVELEELGSVLSRITQGERWVPGGFYAGFREEQEFQKEILPGKEKVTSRQKMILLGVALGLANKQIAHRLGISEETVKSCLRRLGKRFKTPNRAGLAVSALLYGILHPQDLLAPKLPYHKDDSPLSESPG